MKFGPPKLEGTNAPIFQPEALEAFFSDPSEETLKNVHLNDPGLKYDKLKNLIVKVEALYREKHLPIIIQLLFRCLSRLSRITADRGKYDEAEDCLKRILEIEPENKQALNAMARLDTRRGRDAEAREYQLKYLETTKNRAFRKYKIIQRLISEDQPESRLEAEKLIIELLQTLPAKGEQDLKFLVLCAFYTLSPEHELWPLLENETGITKEAIAKVTKKTGEVTSLEHAYLKTNTLWARPYSSTPVDRNAIHGVSDPNEVTKDIRKAKK